MTNEIKPDSRGSRILFTVFFVCSALTCAVAGFFFIIGLGDGSVSSFNMSLWLVLLAGMGLSLWAGWFLRAGGRPGLAIAVLAFTAIPGALAAFFMLLVLITQPRWN